MTLSLLVVAVLAQAKPECITVKNSQRVCGYHCLMGAGQVGRCAQTPGGVCIDNAGAIVCFDPPLWLATAWGGTPPAPKCLTDGSATACGYNCVNKLGRVGCSQTPMGVCKAKPDNSIVCADPPPEVYGVFGSKTPRMTCIDYLEEVACGYGCVEQGGVLGCQKTPFGVCDTREAKPVCIDPDRFVICAGGARTEKPTCLQHAGRITCGYKCVTFGSAAACAKTPGGSCDTEGAQGPVCFDPPVRGGDSKCLKVIGSE
jgi:hypothetical protein